MSYVSGRYEMENLSYSTLESATNGFSEKLELGKGRFGKVYRARLPSVCADVDVAIKRVHDDGTVCAPGKQFYCEVQTMFVSNCSPSYLFHLVVFKIYLRD